MSNEVKWFSGDDDDDDKNVKAYNDFDDVEKEEEMRKGNEDNDLENDGIATDEDKIDGNNVIDLDNNLR